MQEEAPFHKVTYDIEYAINANDTAIYPFLRLTSYTPSYLLQKQNQISFWDL